MAKVLKEHQGR